MAKECIKISDMRKQEETQHSHSDGSHVKEEECDEECRIVPLLPKELIQNIISRLPTADLLKVQSLFSLWCNEMLLSCELFCNIWDERHSESWLVLDGVDGVSLFDTRKGRWIKKVFDLQLRSSYWRLRAADGGLLVYSSKHGNLHVLNPLTMESCQLPDALNLSDYLEEHSLSSYLLNCVCLKNTKASVVEIKLKVDWRVEKVYTVLVVVEDFYLSKRYVLKYKSSRQSWEIGCCKSFLPCLDVRTILYGDKHLYYFVGMLRVDVCFLEKIQWRREAHLGRRWPLPNFPTLYQTICFEVLTYKERTLIIAASTYFYWGYEYVEALHLSQYMPDRHPDMDFDWKSLGAINIDEFYMTADKSKVCRIRIKDFRMNCVSGDGEYIWIIPAGSEWMVSISIDGGGVLTKKWWLNPTRKKSWLDLFCGLSKAKAFDMRLKLSPRP